MKNILIEELHRFQKEFNKIPTSRDFKSKVDGYHGLRIYLKYFKTWANALEEAGLSRAEIKITKKCKNCGKEFTSPQKENRNFCCQSCAAKYNNKNRSRETIEKQIKSLKATLNLPENHHINYGSYRNLCKFKRLTRYYEYFEGYELYKEYGFSNTHNNLLKKGVHLDHMFSIKDAYILSINPAIISHPANCQFLLNTENSIKNSKSSITLDELLERIDNWNEKFGENKNDYLVRINFEYENFISIRYSPITGRIYHPKLKPAEGWDNPNRISAKILAKMFNFELGNPYTTEKNILNAIEILKHHYFNEKISANKIKEIYNIEHNFFHMFLKNIFRWCE